ncbi:hypothetical protein CRYUN_Cryun03dG0042000 [Craigia yunnanensis]
MTNPLAIMAALITYFQLFSLLIVFLTIPISTRVIMASPLVVKAAYWPSGTTTFLPSAIDTSLFTHIYYAFLMPSNVTYKFEMSSSTTLLLSNFTTTLHHKNPPVKTLFSIGGGGFDPLLFARMASESKSRKAFITSAIEVARKFGFDGMDLDWEFPKSPKDMQDLGLLFMEWRRAINYEAKATHRAPLLLTAAVYFSVDFFLDEVYREYPVSSITQNLDWVMDKSRLPRGKLVMGLPLYGRTWQLKDPNSHEIGSAAVAVGPGDDGALTFVEVEEFNKKNGAKVEHDMDSVSTYSYVGSTWIGYDDDISATLKIGFAQALGIRGYFFWALSFDSEWKISRQASRAWILS